MAVAKDVTKPKLSLVVDKVRKSFMALGSEPPFQSKSNSEGAAWEYFIASQLYSAAEARRKKAITAAVEAGVLFDHKKEPRSVGDHTVYDGEFVIILLKVTEPAQGFDHKAFLTELRASGKLDTKWLEKLVSKCETENAPAHRFTAAAKNEGR